MTASSASSVLRQMTQARAPVAADVPLTVSRAIRLALTRAAERSIGLTLTVISVAEETLSLDDLSATLSDDQLMIALKRGSTVGGLVACDFQFVAAAGEVQTTGRLGVSVPDPRKMTGVDQALVEPVLARLLGELAQTTPRTALDGWVDATTLAHRFETVRRVPFDLIDVPYRLIRISLEFGVPDREATLLMAMPQQAQAVEIRQPTVPQVNWDEEFQAAVRKAPATLDAVLHRMQLPLDVAANLEVGQVLPLPGCTVGAVQLVAPGGKVVARARLGQVAGQIAVRLQEDDDVPMVEMPRKTARQKVTPQDDDFLAVSDA